MISVKLVEDGERLGAMYKRFGQVKTEYSMAVSATDGESELGLCLFEIRDKTIYIGTLTPQNDLPLADGILRSALHVAVNREIMDAEYTENAHENVLEKLDFIKNNKNKTLKIEKLFSTCQNCG